MSVNSLDSDSISTSSSDCQRGLAPVNNSVSCQRESVGGVVNPEPYKSQVNATVSQCQTVEVGPKFKADKITFVINSETGLQSHHNLASSVLDSFKVNGDFNKQNKNTIYFKIVNLSLFLLVFVLFFIAIDKISRINAPPHVNPTSTVVYVGNSTAAVLRSTISMSESNCSSESSLETELTTGEGERNSDSVIHTITTITPRVFYSTTIPPTLSDAETTVKEIKTTDLFTEFTTVSTKQNYKDTTAVQATSRLATKSSTIQTTRDKIDITNSTFGVYTTTTFPPRSNYQSEPHYNESLLILSKIYRGFEVYPIDKLKFFPSTKYKSVRMINIVFYPTDCQTLSYCLKYMEDIPEYSDTDFSFFLLGNLVFYNKGWTAPIEPDKANDPMFFRILIMLRDRREISEKHMYIYLLLVYSSIRCGYLDTDFTVTVSHNKFDDYLGYSKFMNIINNSTANRYYVDGKDDFDSDSKKFTARVPKPCPLFQTCNNTCEEQSCLQPVYDDSELCYFQCL